METDILRQFAENEQTRAMLKAELEVANAEKDRLQTIIVGMFSEEGTQSQKINMPDGSKRTIHLRRELWAGHAGDAQALCEALKGGGYESYVKETFNVQSISSLVKEMAADYYGAKELGQYSVEQILEAVPDEIRQAMKLSELFKVGMRSA